MRKFSFHRFDYDPLKNAEYSESDDNSSFTDFFVANSHSLSDETVNDDGISDNGSVGGNLDNGESVRNSNTKSSPIKSFKNTFKRSKFLG